MSGAETAFPERHLSSILEKSKCKFVVFHAQRVFTSVDFDIAEFFFFLFLFNFGERFFFDEVLLWLCSVALLNFLSENRAICANETCGGFGVEAHNQKDVLVAVVSI